MCFQHPVFHILEPLGEFFHGAVKRHFGVDAHISAYVDRLKQQVARFLGNPPINVFKGHIKAGKVYVGEECVSSCPGLPEKEVYVGIRPEGFLLPREIERQGASFHEILLDGLESMEGRLTLDIENIQANGKDVSLIGSHAFFVGDQLKITMDSETKPEIGKETFLVRASKLYLFDAVTEERIRF